MAEEAAILLLRREGPRAGHRADVRSTSAVEADGKHATVGGGLEEPLQHEVVEHASLRGRERRVDGCSWPRGLRCFASGGD